jgi:hypothetical protein
MPGNKQLDMAADFIKKLPKRLATRITSLQKDLSALTVGGFTPPRPPKKELIRALEKLRTAVNKAILALEKRIDGSPTKSGAKKRATAPRTKKAVAARRKSKAA